MKEFLFLVGSVAILSLFYVAITPSPQIRKIEQFEQAVKNNNMIIMAALYKSIVKSSKDPILCEVALYQDSIDIKFPLSLVRKDCQ
jgi:hypothetical protein